MNFLFRTIYRQPKLIQLNKFCFSDKKVEDSKVPEFIKHLDKTPKQLEDLQKKSTSDMLYHYGSYKRSLASQTFNKVEFMAKAYRHGWFRLGDVYHSHKHVIPVKRLRTKEDTLFKLLAQGEIAGVLQGREEYDEIHFILDKQYTKHLMRY
jgi:hypothetical protein